MISYIIIDIRRAFTEFLGCLSILFTLSLIITHLTLSSSVGEQAQPCQACLDFWQRSLPFVTKKTGIRTGLIVISLGCLLPGLREPAEPCFNAPETAVPPPGPAGACDNFSLKEIRQLDPKKNKIPGFVSLCFLVIFPAITYNDPQPIK